MRQKLVPGPFLIWYIIQHSHYMQEIILNVRNFETGLSKRINKVNFLFSFEPSPFQRKKDHGKQKKP